MNIDDLPPELIDYVTKTNNDRIHHLNIISKQLMPHTFDLMPTIYDNSMYRNISRIMVKYLNWKLILIYLHNKSFYNHVIYYIRQRCVINNCLKLFNNLNGKDKNRVCEIGDYITFCDKKTANHLIKYDRNKQSNLHDSVQYSILTQNCERLEWIYEKTHKKFDIRVFADNIIIPHINDSRIAVLKWFIKHKYKRFSINTYIKLCKNQQIECAHLLHVYLKIGALKNKNIDK